MPSLPEDVDRIVAAFFHAAAQFGYRHLTLDRIAKEAGVRLTSLEARFSTKEELLLLAKEEFASQLWTEVSTAFREHDEWPWQIKAGLHAGISYIVEAGSLARLFIVEANAISLAATERQAMNLDRFGGLLRDGRKRGEGPRGLTPVAEDLLIGGVVSIVATHLRAEDPVALKALEPDLLEMLLMPYVGRDEARRIAGR